MSLITIQLNGEPREVPEGLTLRALLDWLKLPADRVAVERNLEIVPRNRWPETPILGGDRLEVVHFVGGGASVRGRGASEGLGTAPKAPAIVRSQKTLHEP